MQSREIDRAEWRPFTEAFSRGHEGWLVSLYAEGPGVARVCIARDVPFRGIATEIDVGHQSAIIMVDGSAARHLTHTVDDPGRIAVSIADDGTEVAISVDSKSGGGLTAEFGKPMPISVQDGVAGARPR